MIMSNEHEVVHNIFSGVHPYKYGNLYLYNQNLKGH